ncbi:MAG: GNAT family N-acetyltransferase, partial [Pseudomonadota bacterium]
MAAVLESQLHIRPMRRSDLSEVSEIEQDAYSFPWSYGIFSDCLRIGYCCRVLEQGGEISGYAVLSAAAGEAHLLNLCVAASVRQQGLGQALLDGMLL